MASSAQINATQANAHNCTGHCNADCQARCKNTLRHGLTARYLVIRHDEQDEFAALQDSLSTEIAPHGDVEAVIFQELIHAAWNLHRFRRVESEASLGTIADFSDPATATVLDRLTRYQARARRAFQKALQELRVLQTNRALRVLKLSEEEDAGVPAIASINDLTKQTHSEVTAEAIELALQMTDFEAGALTLQALRKRSGTAPSEPTS